MGTLLHSIQQGNIVTFHPTGWEHCYIGANRVTLLHYNQEFPIDKSCLYVCLLSNYFGLLAMTLKCLHNSRINILIFLFLVRSQWYVKIGCSHHVCPPPKILWTTQKEVHQLQAKILASKTVKIKITSMI